MNHVFVDTSAFLPALDKGDKFYPEAVKKWSALARGKAELWTTDYVRLESWSLIQRRLGAEAVMSFRTTGCPYAKYMKWVVMDLSAPLPSGGLPSDVILAW